MEKEFDILDEANEIVNKRDGDFMNWLYWMGTYHAERGLDKEAEKYFNLYRIELERMDGDVTPGEEPGYEMI